MRAGRAWSAARISTVATVAVLSAALLGVTAPGAAASAPGRSASPSAPGRSASTSAPAPLDCTHWRYGPADEPPPGTFPPEFDRNAYKRTSLRDPLIASSPHQLCGQKGSAVDLAWGITEGDPSVRIAVLDSGIEWRDANAMRDLADRAYINLGEVQPPCRPAHRRPPVAGEDPAKVAADLRAADCNHDGRFSISDFGPIPDLNHNGVADPEDLILNPRYANGRDDDHNGYVDDISGWDFLYGDNDPLDTVHYGHGTGEARDSTAADNGVGSVGTCPHCTFIPVRVGDSFIAEGDASRPGCCSRSTRARPSCRRPSERSTTHPRRSRRSTPPTRRACRWSRRWRTRPPSTPTCPRRSTTRSR